METLISGVLMTFFLLFLLQFYGSSHLTMNRANILHQGLNLAEGAAAGVNVSAEGYGISQEEGEYRSVKVKYRGKDLLNIFQAP